MKCKIIRKITKFPDTMNMYMESVSRETWLDESLRLHAGCSSYYCYKMWSELMFQTFVNHGVPVTVKAKKEPWKEFSMRLADQLKGMRLVEAA